MNYWLMKTEPDAYSFEDLKREGTGTWDGVRNYAARNFMKEMKVGDRIYIYHSVSEKAIVGMAEVVKEAFQDPTTDDDRWVAIQLKALEPLPHPVSLAQIKEEASLADFPLVRQSRLSVMPVTAAQHETLSEMAKKG